MVHVEPFIPLIVLLIVREGEPNRCMRLDAVCSRWPVGTAFKWTEGIDACDTSGLIWPLVKNKAKSPSYCWAIRYSDDVLLSGCGGRT
jgi:hypothetical protein